MANDTLARALALSAMSGGTPGPMGPTGPQGPMGPTGPAGPSSYSAGNGIDITSGTISYKGTTLWAVYNNGTLDLYDHDPNE